MDNNFPKEFVSVFELGIINGNPAVKVLREHDMCPISLAALMTALFEAVMKTVEESNQNLYETAFRKAFRTIMKERHNYDVSYKRIDDEDFS